ncbi:MAG: MmgE/PrpD family protein, partial [Desulfotignum sp.]|nr:MmgE/PrpD family protein [Desulfotignum sp.]
SIMAAYANGAMVHSLDFDDTHDPSTLHPAASCLPAVLALSEKSGSLSGKDIITAVAVGNDTICRMGLAYPLGISVGGLLAPMTFGIFGAAMASGRIIGLNKEQMVSCLGLAYTQTSGSAQHFHDGGSDVRLLYQSFGGKIGVLSALMAQKGIDGGGTKCLDGKNGFYDLFLNGDYDPGFLQVELEDKYEITNISIKPYPSCRQTHAYIDATRILMEKHNITPDCVNKIILNIGKLGEHLCTPEQSRKRPTSVSDAKFSIPFTVAACLVNGTVDLPAITEESLKNPKILDMTSKISWLFDDDINSVDGMEPGIVTIECRDGNAFTEKVTDSLGSPKNQMSDDQLAAKFMDCVSYSVKPLTNGSAQKVVDLCLNLEKVDNILAIIDLLA